jgi:hypothetical protein
MNKTLSEIGNWRWESLKFSRHVPIYIKNFGGSVMEKIEIKVSKSWERQVIEYFEDLEILSHDYNRAVLRQLGKLNRLLHEELVEQYEYDILNKALLKTSASLSELPNAIEDIR